MQYIITFLNLYNLITSPIMIIKPFFGHPVHPLFAKKRFAQASRCTWYRWTINRFCINFSQYFSWKQISYTKASWEKPDSLFGEFQFSFRGKRCHFYPNNNVLASHPLFNNCIDYFKTWMLLSWIAPVFIFSLQFHLIMQLISWPRVFIQLLSMFIINNSLQQETLTKDQILLKFQLYSRYYI